MGGMETDYLVDEVFAERLLISKYSDQNELSSNIRAARVNSKYLTRREIEGKIEILKP